MNDSLHIARPDGPVVTIHQDGNIDVHKGPMDEVAKAFWEAVGVHGRSLAAQVKLLEAENHELTMQCATLMHDPFKTVIHGPVEKVWQQIPKAARGRMVRADVHAVLDAINQLAIKEIM
jgi:hypothetical protein